MTVLEEDAEVRAVARQRVPGQAAVVGGHQENVGVIGRIRRGKAQAIEVGEL